MRELKVFGECVRDGADAGSLSVDVIRGAGISKRSVALFVRTRELPGGPQSERAAGPSDADVSGPRDATAGNPLLASFLSARRNERAQEKLMSSGSRSVGGGGSGASPGGKKAGRAGGPKVLRSFLFFFFLKGVAAHEPKSTTPPARAPRDANPRSLPVLKPRVCAPVQQVRQGHEAVGARVGGHGDGAAGAGGRRRAVQG